MQRKTTLLTIGSYISMFFLGVSGAIVGASAKNIGLTPYQIGLMIAAQNLGFTLSLIASGILSDSMDKTRILSFGSFILSASFLLFYCTPLFFLNILIMFFIGVGTGIYEGTTDVMLLEIHKKNKSLYINTNHFFVNFGALTITLYLIFLKMNWRNSTIQSGIFVLLIGVLFLLLKTETRKKSETTPIRERFKLLLNDFKTIGFIFILTMLAVGIETSSIGILTSFLVDLRGFNNTVSKVGLIIFISGIASGRLIVGSLSKKIRVITILKALFLLSTVISSILYFINLGNWIFPVIFLNGFAISALLPLLITITGKLYPTISGTALGIIKIGIPAGGIVLPLIISFITKYSGFKHSLLIFPITTLLGFAILISMGTKKLDL